MASELLFVSPVIRSQRLPFLSLHKSPLGLYARLSTPQQAHLHSQQQRSCDITNMLLYVDQTSLKCMHIFRAEVYCLQAYRTAVTTVELWQHINDGHLLTILDPFQVNHTHGICLSLPVGNVRVLCSWRDPPHMSNMSFNISTLFSKEFLGRRQKQTQRTAD